MRADFPLQIEEAHNNRQMTEDLSAEAHFKFETASEFLPAACRSRAFFED
jgi:hypothetical protein